MVERAGVYHRHARALQLSAILGQHTLEVVVDFQHLVEIYAKFPVAAAQCEQQRFDCGLRRS